MRHLTVIGRFLLILLVLACAFSGASSAAAQSDSDTDQNPGDAARILQEKARQQGSLRVILTVDTEYQPEGLLAGAAAIAGQRTKIGQVQAALVERISDAALGKPYRYATLPLLAATLTAEGLKTALDSGLVSAVQEDTLAAASLIESAALVGATSAWTSSYSGAGQAIAILDTGVDKSHPFLAGKVVSEACYSTTDVDYFSSSVCPGGVSESIAAGSALPCSVAGCDHGTHVAGIAAGKGASFSGVAKDASLIAIQVFSRFDSAVYCGSNIPCVLTWESDQIKGLERVYQLRGTYRIAAVNMSLGGDYSEPCDEDARKLIIDQLRAAGIATVIASGNNGYTNRLSAPACISSAVSVGSTGDGSYGATVDAVSNYSNSGPNLTLLAPGSVITSSLPGGGYGNKNGTSMSTPHVSGAWAVLKSKNPWARFDDIYKALVNTGLPVYDPRNGITKPRIRLVEALAAVPNPPVLNKKQFLPVIHR